MPLGTHTKCELSAGIATIDLASLTAQMELHFYSIVREMQKKSNDIMNNTLSETDRRDKVSSMSSTGADNFVKMANSLAETTELLHTLHCAKERAISIV